jgi:hypothetical protein
MPALTDHPIAKRLPCAVCGLDTFRHTGWFLVAENRWLDRLKILSWHSSLVGQEGVKSVCCRQHLKTLVAHWLTQASLRLPLPTLPWPPSGGSSPEDGEPLPGLVARLIGELAVHRESVSSIWSGSPEALESILDALLTIGADNKRRGVEFRRLDSLGSPAGLSLQ